MDPSLEEEVLLLAVVLDEEEVDEPQLVFNYEYNMFTQYCSLVESIFYIFKDIYKFFYKICVHG
jgi:hypothetical protein